jgi:SHAQKYF class myb-like DNA-binding protein
MKNEFSIGQHIKFMTYVVPHPRDENLNKVKIEMETGNLVSSRNETLNRPPVVKPQNTAVVSLNNSVPNTPTPIKQEVVDKPSSLPNPTKVLVSTKQNNIIFNTEIKREEQPEPVNNDPPYNIKISDTKIPVLDNVIVESKNEVQETGKIKLKKRKRETKSNNNNITSEGDIKTGRWSKEEHKKFIEAICKFGNEWKKVQQYIKSRSSTQARSHAQKFFLRLKKKFNLSNKDSETSIAELAKLPEDIIINYIRECTNTDTNINIEEKDRLINVLVNFANFNKKNKRRKRKNSLEKEDFLSQPSNIKIDNNILSSQNGDYKDDFFSNEENDLSINNFQLMTEDLEEEIDEMMSKSKKIFKITKEPRLKNEDHIRSICQDNKLVTLLRQMKNNDIPKIPQGFKMPFKEPLIIKEDPSINQEKPNSVSVPFNIKVENNIPKPNLIVNQSEQLKSQIATVGEPNNKQNYNYINIMTINLCPPNLVNGTQNKQVVHQSQIPVSQLLNNLNNNNNDPTSQKMRNQFLQHLISNNIVNIKTIPNNIITSNNNNNCNNMNRSTFINQLQNNLNNNINISNNISQKPAGVNPVLNPNNSAYTNFIKAELIQNNVNLGVGNNSQNVNVINNNNRMGINSTNNVGSNNNNVNNNKFLNNMNNLNFLNTNNLSNQTFNNGKYDEIKNYYNNNFSKANNGNNLNNSNSLRNTSLFSNSCSTMDISNEKLKQKSKNSIKLPVNKVSQMAVRDFLLKQANQINQAGQINQASQMSQAIQMNNQITVNPKVCGKSNLTNVIKQVSMFNLRNL